MGLPCYGIRYRETVYPAGVQVPQFEPDEAVTVADVPDPVIV
jgi:hypothetical protein